MPDYSISNELTEGWKFMILCTLHLIAASFALKVDYKLQARSKYTFGNSTNNIAFSAIRYILTMLAWPTRHSYPQLCAGACKKMAVLICEHFLSAHTSTWLNGNDSSAPKQSWVMWGDNHVRISRHYSTIWRHQDRFLATKIIITSSRIVSVLDQIWWLSWCTGFAVGQ